jgi:hypothetical protein
MGGCETLKGYSFCRPEYPAILFQAVRGRERIGSFSGRGVLPVSALSRQLFALS